MIELLLEYEGVLMKEKSKKKVLKVSLMVVLLIVFVYVTFKTTLVVISNKYLTDIGDYSTMISILLHILSQMKNLLLKI